MKIETDRDALADAVAFAARALPNRPAVPVLAGMVLEAGENLTLSTFDYDTSARASIPAAVEEPGKILVSGRLLAEIAKSLPPRPVRISADGARATLACGSATFTLLTMPVEDYPALPAMPEPAGRIGAATFAQAVSQAGAAAGRDDTLPALTGVKLVIDGDRWTLAATDRYRLAVREAAWAPAVPGFVFDALIPARTLTDAAKAMAGAAEVAVSVTAGDGLSGSGMIGFEGDGRRATARLLGGDFPRYQNLLPKETSGAAELAVAPFADAVKRVALVAERNTAVRLSFAPGEVVLEAGTGEEAQAVEVLECAYDGEDLAVAFNPQYLLEGLLAVEGDVAQIQFTGPGKAVLITGKPGDGEPEFRYLLMPIRLGS